MWKRINEYSVSSGIDGLISASSAVICAFSGGADSSVLLRWLKHRLDGTGVRLAAAHVNHMIRGGESDGDEEFCRRTAEALDIPFYYHRVNIPSIAAERGVGLEECARDERYAFLSNLAETLGGALVATAHSATDNVETVIFNLCRGCGTKGMTGIDPVRGKFIRPLLCCTSDEIRDFAKRENIEFVIDSTNSDDGCTRNYIRSLIVPALRTINPRADSAFLRLSDAAREDCAYIEDDAARFINEHEIIKREDIAALPRSLFARVLGLMWKDASGSSTDLSSKNISDCLKLSRSGFGRIDLGGGYSFFCRKDRVYIEVPQKVEIAAPCRLNVPGVAEFGKYNIIVSPTRQNIYNLSTETVVDFDKIYGELYVRARQQGDTVLTGKMHKKLKKLMCDKNVPVKVRDVLPVICDDEGIVAVPGVARRDGVADGEHHMYIYIEDK